MDTTIINIRTNARLKSAAQKVAEDLGFSLSTLIKGYLKHLIKTKKVLFSAQEEPSEYLIKAIEEARQERKRGRYYSFKKPEDAVAFIDKIIKKEKHAD